MHAQLHITACTKISCFQFLSNRLLNLWILNCAQDVWLQIIALRIQCPPTPQHSMVHILVLSTLANSPTNGQLLHCMPPLIIVIPLGITLALPCMCKLFLLCIPYTCAHKLLVMLSHYFTHNLGCWKFAARPTNGSGWYKGFPQAV